jgi:hypothetical protein
LGEDGVLVREARDDRGVVKEDDDHEDGADREEHRRRVRDPGEAGERVEPAPPERQDEHHRRREEPEEGVALPQRAAPDQLQHDEEERERDERRDDRDAQGRHARPAVAGVRKSPTKSATSTFAM